MNRRDARLRPQGRQETALRQAVALLQAGRLDEAQAQCRNALAVDPDEANLLNVLGVCLLQLGKPELAVEILQQAERLAPGDAGMLANLGSALQAAGRGQDALRVLERAAAAMPRVADVHYNLGNLLRSIGRSEEAIAAFDRAIRLAPDHLRAIGNRGNALRDLGRQQESLADFELVAAVSPLDPAARFNRGVALQELGRVAEAIAEYEVVLRLRPDHAEAHHNLGLARKALGQREQALACFERALELRASYPEARAARGNILLELGRFEELLDNIDRELALNYELRRFDEVLENIDLALVVNPASVEHYLFRGDVLRKTGREGEAIAAYDHALKIDPDNFKARINRGTTFLDCAQIGPAQADFRQVIQRHPDNSRAHWNEALCLLLQGDLAAGWRKYEWRLQRWRDEKLFGELFHDESPAWDGVVDPFGKTMLLHAEQGLGDTIQFCRYAKLLADRGARILLEVQPALLRLLSGIRGIERVSPRGAPVPHFDLHAPLLSLPLALGTTLGSIPVQVPYIEPDPDLVEAWRRRLGVRGRGPRVGIAWRGNPGHARDRDRSIPLVQLAPWTMSQAEWISLQVGVSAIEKEEISRQGLRDVEELLGDFADTAALIAEVDLVISVDTAIAHLAGAMGKPVWILVPYAPDWRWMLGRTDSPWYPSARLFRQRRLHDWSGTIDEVARELSGVFGQFGADLRDDIIPLA